MVANAEPIEYVRDLASGDGGIVDEQEVHVGCVGNRFDLRDQGFAEGVREYLFDIAREFDVSVEALLWKLKKVYNRTEEATRADIEACKQLAKTYETRKEEQPPPVRPERFNALVLKALQRGELSTGRAAEYLGISRREAMKLEELDGAQDAEVAISPA